MDKEEKIIHLTDKEYKKIIENAQNDIKKQYIETVKKEIKKCEKLQKEYYNAENELEIIILNKILSKLKEI